MSNLDLSKIPTTDLINELNKRKDSSIFKDRLKTKSNPEFVHDLYEITKVITPSKDGKHPKVGEQHRCFLSTTVGLISTSGMYTGYYEVEGKKIKDRESWEDYILNLDPNTIVSEDVPYWEKYHKEITDN